MDDTDSTAFFEHWSKLAREDPERFERERREIIEAAIAKAPERIQPALRKLQGEVDEQRKREDFPFMGVLRLHHMMWCSLLDQVEAWQMCERAVSGLFKAR